MYREYPLPNHQFARTAAEAGQCANEQGKFWPYHDRLFANQQKLSVPDLKQHAAELGLDAAKFNACLDSSKYAERVRDGVAAGTRLGVNSTPTLYINGRVIQGAQPYENFAAVVDEELQRQK